MTLILSLPKDEGRLSVDECKYTSTCSGAATVLTTLVWQGRGWSSASSSMRAARSKATLQNGVP